MNEPKTRRMLALLLGVMLFVAGFALGALSNRYHLSGPMGWRIDTWTGQTWRHTGSAWVFVAEPRQ